MNIEFRTSGRVEDAILARYEAEIRQLHALFPEVTRVHCDVENRRELFKIKLQAGNRQTFFAAVHADGEELQAAMRSAIDKTEKILRDEHERANVSHFRESDEEKYERAATLAAINEARNEPPPIDAETLIEEEKRRTGSSG